METTQEEKQKTLVITRKMQIACINESDKKSEFWAFIRSLNDKVFRIANAIMSTHYINEAIAEKLTDKIESEDPKTFWKDFGKAKKEQLKKLQEDIWQMSQQNLGYNLTKGFNEIPSYIRTAISQKVYQDFGNDLIDVKKGKRTQRTYRKGISIPFTKDSIRNLRFTEEKECQFEFLGYDMSIVFGKDKSRNIPILERVINEESEYALCDSSLSVEGKKLFINFCVRIPQQKKELIEGIEAVADISFIAPIYLSNNKNSDVITVGDKTFENLVALRNQMNRRHEDLQASLRYAKGGHGRKRKLQAETQFELKEKAVARTENHRLTKWVIDEVLKLRAKTLIITRKALSKEEEKQKFELRYWGYANIITMLKFKASKYGITVIDKTGIDTVLEQLALLLNFGENMPKEEVINYLCTELELDRKTVKQRLDSIVKNRKLINEIYHLQEIGNQYVLVMPNVQA